MKLLQHFKELTVNPKNAKELKDLILKLAIQGNLTSNWRLENHNIKSASELLKELKTEKKILIKEKKIKNEKSLSKVNKEELIVNLPNSWETVRLGEIGDWGAGSTPLRSNSSFYGGEINWFKSGELNNSVMDYESKEKITELALEKTSVRLNNPGDVLIAMYGATIGKTGILQVVGTTNQAVCACTPFSCITSLFLHLLLKGLKDTFINQGEGGAQPNISRVKIRTQVFGLPPLVEQKEIVKIVETLFKEVEQLEQLTVARIGLKEDFVTSALNQLTTNNANQEWAFLQDHFKSFFNETTNIKKLRETVLQLAVQGKLTADWRANNPDTEDASVLLKRIQKEKAQLIKDKKIKKEKALPKITKDEIPYELPEGWVWSNILDISLKVTDGEHATLIRTESGYKLLSARNVTNEGIRLHKVDYVGEEEFLRIRKRCDPQKGDVLISCSGSVGRVCLVDKDDEYCMVRSAALVKQHHDYINGMFLCYALRSPILQTQIVAKSRSTAQSNLFLGKIKELIFPLPPLEEQKAIVEKVNVLMDLCDSLEQEVQQSQEHSEQLMQSCLRAVFESNT